MVEVGCQRKCLYENRLCFEMKIYPFAVTRLDAESFWRQDLADVRDQNETERLGNPIDQTPCRHRVLREGGNPCLDLVLCDSIRPEEGDGLMEVFGGDCEH